MPGYPVTRRPAISGPARALRAGPRRVRREGDDPGHRGDPARLGRPPPSPSGPRDPAPTISRVVDTRQRGQRAQGGGKGRPEVRTEPVVSRGRREAPQIPGQAVRLPFGVGRDSLLEDHVNPGGREVTDGYPVLDGPPKSLDPYGPRFDDISVRAQVVLDEPGLAEKRSYGPVPSPPRELPRDAQGVAEHDDHGDRGPVLGQPRDCGAARGRPDGGLIPGGTFGHPGVSPSLGLVHERPHRGRHRRRSTEDDDRGHPFRARSVTASGAAARQATSPGPSRCSRGWSGGPGIRPGLPRDSASDQPPTYGGRRGARGRAPAPRGPCGHRPGSPRGPRCRVEDFAGVHPGVCVGTIDPVEAERRHHGPGLISPRRRDLVPPGGGVVPGVLGGATKVGRGGPGGGGPNGGPPGPRVAETVQVGGQPAQFGLGIPDGLLIQYDVGGVWSQGGKRHDIEGTNAARSRRTSGERARSGTAGDRRPPRSRGAGRGPGCPTHGRLGPGYRDGMAQEVHHRHLRVAVDDPRQEVGGGDVFDHPTTSQAGPIEAVVVAVRGFDPRHPVDEGCDFGVVVREGEVGGMGKVDGPGRRAGGMERLEDEAIETPAGQGLGQPGGAAPTSAGQQQGARRLAVRIDKGHGR